MHGIATTISCWGKYTQYQRTIKYNKRFSDFKKLISIRKTNINENLYCLNIVLMRYKIISTRTYFWIFTWKYKKIVGLYIRSWRTKRKLFHSILKKCEIRKRYGTKVSQRLFVLSRVRLIYYLKKTGVKILLKSQWQR